MMIETLKEMAARKCNNWTPETASLIATLKRHGFEIVRGDNGEDEFKCGAGRDGMKTFIANLTACDEARLYVKGPGSAKLRWLYLVFGNSPGELVSDMNIPSDVDFSTDPLDKVTNEHYDRWDGRKQPTYTYAEAYPDQYSDEAIARRATEGSVK